MLKKGKIHFFTGKGGVGKSTLSVAFAHTLARQGHKTLWLEFSQNPTIRAFPNQKLAFKPTPIEPNLEASSWNGEDCLQEFVRHSVKLRLIYETFYRSKAITALIKAAPALREIAFLGYLTSHLRDVKPSLDYDQIIVDAPSTGHFLASLKVPSALLDISSFGPMGFHCNGILKVLKDPESTAIYNVFFSDSLVLIEQEYLQKELLNLGFNSVPWMNKTLNHEMIQDMNKALSKEKKEFEYADRLNQIKKQQDQAIQNFGNLKIILTEEGNTENLNQQMSKIVKILTDGMD